MGYSWLITARYDYLCCQHAGASTGREAVGDGYNNLSGIWRWLFVVLFVLFRLNCCMVV